ncbi:hypothetical protein OB2597_04430 [Pseudooceanicola batsensis HTCC2597]|uniref:AB hydrolase-1 domain-containing protein n=1 Tax=Pseudooceanicola batsensis (strain ATCC BAA-863 / DSM 15984 / KCTC 12145 / HTCC2597) TaxID=252305 RepID=A3U3L8_PSEBH|nr:alpha/beta fold hydrolase [Pseudooceanicola batsensis]EAQ01220.1 hypothetical protein OB2597_04430 [Pseudooceanicola batsensis HTCC2597]
MIGRVLGFLAISAVVTGGIALGLIVSDRPGGAAATGPGGLDFGSQLGRSVEPLPVERVEMRDGSTALVRHLAGPEGAPLVVMAHGSGWDGGQFDALARALSDVAEVVAPDLRGHGAEPERRGDVDHVGQMEDDLADLIAFYRRDETRRVVLLGHSSGGGLVIRFANGAHRGLLDGAVLLAPFVQYDAPMQRENSGGWARPLTRRIVGLTMLNTVGITALDHLVAIEFAMPEAVVQGPEGHRATTAYSWRLNKGYAPRRDWRSDVSALPGFLLVAGAEDEAFVAELYEPEFTKETDRGEYLVVPDAGHLDIVDAPGTVAAVKAFLNDV